MKSSCNPKSEKRDELLKICMGKGMTLDAILEISKEFIGKTDKEKEALAGEILKTL